MKTWNSLDKRQRGLVKLIFERAPIGECALDLVCQDGTYLGISAALKTAEQISAGDTRRALVVRCDAKAGIYDRLRDSGGRGVGYGPRIKALLAACVEQRRAFVLVVDHGGELAPDAWSKLFRCIDEAAYRCDVAARMVIVMDWVHRWSHEKKMPVAQVPYKNEVLHPRHRTWHYTRTALELTKQQAQIELIENELFDAAHEEERARKVG